MKFALADRAGIEKLDTAGVKDGLAYVGDVIAAVKQELAGQTALLGFAGSPWTLANFMLEGGSSGSFAKAKLLFDTDRATYDLLAAKLARGVTDFLQLQIDSGVDAIQIFDSVGGLLHGAEFEAASGQWIRRIIAELHGQVPVIVFAKGVREWAALAQTGAAALGIDHGIALTEAARHLPGTMALQGNFDPDLLATASGRRWRRKRRAFSRACAGGPAISSTWATAFPRTPASKTSPPWWKQQRPSNEQTHRRSGFGCQV